MVHATILGIDERSVVFCIMYMELSVLAGWLVIVPSPTLQFDFITGNNTIRTYVQVLPAIKPMGRHRGKKNDDESRRNATGELSNSYNETWMDVVGSKSLQ